MVFGFGLFSQQFVFVWFWYENVSLLYATGIKMLPFFLCCSHAVIFPFYSLPLFSHPVFERTATFLFGRIQIGKYQTNVTLASDFPFEKVMLSTYAYLTEFLDLDKLTLCLGY